MSTDILLPQVIARMDQDRLRSYREHLEFYNGAQWATARRGRERRLTLNYGRALIDKLTSYLMSELSFAVDPDGGSRAAKERARRAEAALYEVYYRNNLDVLDFDTEIDTAVLGDGCYKVIWDAQQGRVRVTAPDVQGVYVWWIPDDIGQVWRVASRYAMSGENVEMLYGLADRGVGTAGGRRSYVTEVWTNTIFDLWIDSRLYRSVSNPYGFIPFVIFPNIRQPKKFWGVSDIEPIVESARELNRAFSALSNIVELSGNPIAVLENVDDAQDIAVAPGAVWEIPERARAYLLDLLSGGGVGFHAEYINLIYRTIHDLGEAPRTAFGDNQRNLSGVALEVELQPLLQKVKRKRLIRAAAYRRRNEMILRIMSQQGRGDFAPYQSRVLWGPVTPKDEARDVQTEAAKVAAALCSRRRSMNTLGIPDPEAELAAWLEESERMARVPSSRFQVEG